MHRRRFNALLKRRVSPYLFLVTGARAARARGLHPDTLMVFERGRTGFPMFVCAITADDGKSPREPDDRDLAWIQSQDMDRVAAGRQGWVDDVAAGELEKQLKDERRQFRDRKEMFDEEVAPRVLHRHHQGRSYAAAFIDTGE